MQSKRYIHVVMKIEFEHTTYIINILLSCLKAREERSHDLEEGAVEMSGIS